MFMQDTYWRNKLIRRSNKRRRKTSLTKYLYLSLYCKGSKRVTRGLRVRGIWRPNRNCNILTSTLMAVNVVSFSFFWCSTGGLGAHSAGCWLPLQHLISIFSGPQFIRASRGPLRPGVAFLTTSRLQLRPIFNSTRRNCPQLNWQPNWLVELNLVI